MPDEPSPDRKGGFLAFWTTLPGILTGLGALITAIVGVVGLWKFQSGGGDNGGAQAPLTDITGVSHQLSLAPGDGANLEKGQIGSLVNTDLAFGPESTPTLRAGASTFFAPVEARQTRRGAPPPFPAGITPPRSSRRSRGVGSACRRSKARLPA
jgi:hypothetical protein